MKRTAAGVGLAVAALALLISLVLQSRSVPIDAHLSHYAAMAELERLAEDYGTLVASLRSAQDGMRSPGEGPRALTDRIASSPQRLRALLPLADTGTSQQNRLQNSFDGYNAVVLEATALARELQADQTAYADSVDFLRDSGARIIQQMRDRGLDRVTADAFQLLLGTLDFATPAGSVQEYELRRLLVTLGRDQRIDTNMPAEVGGLLQAVETILPRKAEIASKLEQLAATSVPARAGNLSLAADSLYRATVAGVDQARTMLAIYAVLLLAAASFIGYRLHGSYRELNQANKALGDLNESLEQRVAARTDELEGALRELKESEVQLVQAEKMSSLGQLVAGISHEINTPLLYLANNMVLIQERLEIMHEFVSRCGKAFSIKVDDFESRAQFQAWFVEALRELKSRLRKEEIEACLQEALDLAKDSSDGLNDLTEMAQSLKDFSRLDRAPVSSFDVNAGLDKTLLIAKNLVKHKANVRRFYGEIPDVECSPSQINQVFLNIITNAAQSIDKHGEIVITTKLRDDEHVAIRIADTGCGIPEDNLAKIRDPFFTTKEVGAGTGLGLSIVDEIVRSHGGSLEVESQPGRGSAFTVVLPLRQPQAAHEAAGDREAGALQAEAGQMAEAC